MSESRPARGKTWDFVHSIAGDGRRTPGIAHRGIARPEDFEVLEIVSPAEFKTRVVEAPKQAAAT